MNHPRWAAMTVIALGLTLQAPLAISAAPTEAQAPNAVESQTQMAPMMPAPNVVAPRANGEGQAPNANDEDQTPNANDEDQAPNANDEDQTPNANDEDQTPNANDDDRTPGANDEDQSPDVPRGTMPRQRDASGGIRV